MQKIELRVLYLLKKAGGRAKKSDLSMQMHRALKTDRDRALETLVSLGLVHRSEEAPPDGRGGAAGTWYALSDLGHEHVDYLIDQGAMRSPS